ncbi:MAG: carboxypeptidase-like regulatory domain-containing protein [Actinomycetota bacterium]
MTTLSGRVTVHGNQAAGGATVEVHNANGDVLDQVQVDDEGRYTFHLGPGRWSLRVWDAHGHRGRLDLELSDADESIDLDLEEPEGGH